MYLCSCVCVCLVFKIRNAKKHKKTHTNCFYGILGHAYVYVWGFDTLLAYIYLCARVYTIDLVKCHSVHRRCHDCLYVRTKQVPF